VAVEVRFPEELRQFASRCLAALDEVDGRGSDGVEGVAQDALLPWARVQLVQQPPMQRAVEAVVVAAAPDADEPYQTCRADDESEHCRSFRVLEELGVVPLRNRSVAREEVLKRPLWSP